MTVYLVVFLKKQDRNGICPMEGNNFQTVNFNQK
jgi:hypothetical protein